MSALPWSARPPRVLVVVPAHDEQETIGLALASVEAALVVARDAGRIAAGDVVVAAHRCTDATAAIARECLDGLTTGRGLVLEDATSTTVGEVRDRAVRAGLATLRHDEHSRSLRETWLLSSDADSRVPLGWVASLLDPAATEGAVAVAGLVSLVDWHATPAARAAYEQILTAGMLDDSHHRHVYAANLAVRLDAYLAVGGFVPRAHGEEQGLVDALGAAGFPVTSSRRSVVRTSGRMPGRAAAGLGALLERLGGIGGLGGLGEAAPRGDLAAAPLPGDPGAAPVPGETSRRPQGQAPLPGPVEALAHPLAPAPVAEEIA